MRKIYFPMGHNCVIVGDEVKKWGLSDQIAMDDQSGFKYERQVGKTGGSRMKLSLVVPCYNEQDNVRAFYDAAVNAFLGCGYEYELVMVNDGSRDNTGIELKKLFYEKREETPITIVQFSRNFGKEAAILAGMKHAKGDLVTLIDADLQQRPEIVREMVQILDDHPEYDCVAAFQKERNEGKGLSFFKREFYRLINRMSEVEFVNGASDFRTCRRKMVDAILSMPEYHRFSKGIFSWVGFDTYYIPYVAEERHAGKTKWSFWKLFKYAVEGIIGYSTAPLKIATVLGSFTSLLAVIYFIVVVLQRLICGVDVPGYATIVALILLIGGIQLLILGIMGEYIARMYIQGKQRPIFIEKDVLTSETNTKKQIGEK